jgi:hypothetical protein
MTAPRRSRNNTSGLAAELAAVDEEAAKAETVESGTITMTQAELQALLEQAKAKAFADAQEKASLESDDAPELPEVDPNSPNTVTVHFLDDGFTAMGRVWYRGEQYTCSKDSSEWVEEARNWMMMSEYDQVKKYGRRLFAQGQWPYTGYDLDDPDLDPKEREVLKRANAQRAISPKRRSRRSEMTVGG